MEELQPPVRQRTRYALAMLWGPLRRESARSQGVNGKGMHVAAASQPIRRAVEPLRDSAFPWILRAFWRSVRASGERRKGRERRLCMRICVYVDVNVSWVVCSQEEAEGDDAARKDQAGREWHP